MAARACLGIARALEMAAPACPGAFEALEMAARAWLGVERAFEVTVRKNWSLLHLALYPLCSAQLAECMDMHGSH